MYVTHIRGTGYPPKITRWLLIKGFFTSTICLISAGSRNEEPNQTRDETQSDNTTSRRSRDDTRVGGFLVVVIGRIGIGRLRAAAAAASGGMGLGEIG